MMEWYRALSAVKSWTRRMQVFIVIIAFVLASVMDSLSGCYDDQKGGMMKPGTIIEVKDRGVGTVVYHNLDGYGIIWGRQLINLEDLPEPQAMLREQYPSAEYECVGEDYYVEGE